MCVCTCVFPPEGLITSSVIKTVCHCSTAFQFLTIDKVDGYGLSNTACHCTPGKEDKVDTVLTIEVAI